MAWLPGVITLAILQAGLVACASSDVAPEPGVPGSQRDYLLAPFVGYTEAVALATRERIEAAHVALLGSGDAAAAAAVAQALLRLDGELAPAHVLAAQASFVAGRFEEVVDRLSGLLAERPEYTAGQLVLGRAAELAERPVIAYGGYRRVMGAPQLRARQLATRRSRVVERRAIDIVRRRFEEGLNSSRFDDAETALALLVEWVGGDYATLDARRRLALATEDLEAELQVLQEMVAAHSVDPWLRERLGTLELEVGEPRRGLEVFESLAGEYAGDPRLQEQLAIAKFRWRLELMPAEVRELVDRVELTRAEFASLLFWLVPNVRSGATSTPRIATDILDHPRRDEIVRVVNRGLMKVEDETLHRFAPDRVVDRADVFESLLQIPLRFGRDVACVEEMSLVENPTQVYVCRTAAGCGLIPSETDCLPRAPMSGSEALEAMRRALVLLGEG